MAEQDATDQVVGDVTEEELREARSLGWADKDKWKGNPENWVDAKTFLERGKTVLPIVQATNKRLADQLAATQQQLAAQAETLKQANAAIAALEESHAEGVQAQGEEALEELEAQIEQASQNGEHREVAKLTRKMVELQTSLKEAKEKPAARTDDNAGRLPAIPPEVRVWTEENSKYMTGRLSGVFAGVMDQMRREGDRRVGVAFLEAVKGEVDALMGETPATGASRVGAGNGGTGRSSSGGGNGSGKTYSDLPSDARAACDKMAGRFVGDGKKYKDVASWQRAYAKQYFAQE